MRKKVIALVISLGLLITLVGCDDDILQEESCYYGDSMFITVEQARNWNIVYNRGDFTLLVDADGKPMLYKGE